MDRLKHFPNFWTDWNLFLFFGQIETFCYFLNGLKLFLIFWTDWNISHFFGQIKTCFYFLVGLKLFHIFWTDWNFFLFFGEIEKFLIFWTDCSYYFLVGARLMMYKIQGLKGLKCQPCSERKTELHNCFHLFQEFICTSKFNII